MEILTSRANPRIRHVSRLRTGRYRRQTNAFVVDGVREIRRAIDAGMVLLELFIAEATWSQFVGGQDAGGIPDWLQPALSRQAITQVAGGAFEKLAYGDRKEGMVGVFETPARPLEQLVLPANALVMVADRIEKPGNLGAIFRSADAVGVDAVICCDCATDLFHPNVIRASLGTVFAMSAAVCTAAAAQRWLQDRGVRCFAARVDAARLLWDCPLTGAVALVVGAEAAGLGEDWKAEGITIPMAGAADSLNVSVAAAVLAFEARRQRRSESDYRGSLQNR